ncbi:MAG: DUF554 domain-containing protein [Oscillospiraceae bacterium]|nr:DUF554 domain-containing protein [Oscillospiraceae bacterium]
MALTIIIGATINAAAVLSGGLLGLLFKGRLSRETAENITRALGLCVCIIGISGALKGDIMLLVISLALGAFTGGLLDIDGRLNGLGLWLQKKISRDKNTGNNSFAEGFVAASLLFCVGAMAIVGSIESGLRNDQSIIFTKSVIDGVSAVVFASSFGAGVLFAAAAVFVYQGSIEFFAGYLQNILTDELITQLSAAGGVMIFAIGLNMAASAGIKTANLLPGFLFAAGYYYLLEVL